MKDNFDMRKGLPQKYPVRGTIVDQRRELIKLYLINKLYSCAQFPPLAQSPHNGNKSRKYDSKLSMFIENS